MLARIASDRRDDDGRTQALPHIIERICDHAELNQMARTPRQALAIYGAAIRPRIADRSIDALTNPLAFISSTNRAT